MNEDRRQVLQTGTLLGASMLLGHAAPEPSPTSAPAPASPALEPPALNGVIPPGKPGEFDFLQGHWNIRHQRLLDNGQWDHFDGEATCWTILGGIGSVEELRIPSRNFSGMGLRLLDVKAGVWSDFWVNAKSGILTSPGTIGGFINGVGIFEADDTDKDQPIVVRGIWDRIGPGTCRWRQGVSRDGGKTWAFNWIMDWTIKPS